MSAIVVLKLAAFAGAGVVLGLAHFAALRANVRLYVAPGPIWLAIGLNLLRLALTGGGFAATVVFGSATAALAALAGFLLARALLIRTAWSGA